MKKHLLLLLVLLLTNANVNASDNYSTYVKKLATCSPYKMTAPAMFGLKTDSEILGLKNGYCQLKEVTYTYNLPKGVDFSSLTNKQLERYMVPDTASHYNLTKKQLADYRQFLISEMKKAQNNTSTSITVSTNQRSIKSVKNYKYQNGRWVNTNMESYLMYE